MKAVVAAFNQEKALVGALSVLTNIRITFVSSCSGFSGVGCERQGWVCGAARRLQPQLSRSASTVVLAATWCLPSARPVSTSDSGHMSVLMLIEDTSLSGFMEVATHLHPDTSPSDVSSLDFLIYGLILLLIEKI